MTRAHIWLIEWRTKDAKKWSVLPDWTFMSKFSAWAAAKQYADDKDNVNGNEYRVARYERVEP